MRGHSWEKPDWPHLAEELRRSAMLSLPTWAPGSFELLKRHANVGNTAMNMVRDAAAMSLSLSGGLGLILPSVTAMGQLDGAMRLHGYLNPSTLLSDMVKASLLDVTLSTIKLTGLGKVVSGAIPGPWMAILDGKLPPSVLERVAKSVSGSLRFHSSVASHTSAELDRLVSDLSRSLTQLSTLQSQLLARTVHIPHIQRTLCQMGFGNVNMSALAELVADSGDERITATPEGGIASSTQAIGPDELQELVDAVIERSGIRTAEATIADAVNKLVCETRKLPRETLFRKFMVNFIISFLVELVMLFIIGPLLQPTVLKDGGYSGPPRSAVIRTVQRAVSQMAVPREVVRDYRFVTADCLNVREQGSMDSRVIGRLHFGDVIRVVDKRRHWTLVEWTDGEGQVRVRGWVFTRYIAKFRL